jgi:hypothetical protein
MNWYDKLQTDIEIDLKGADAVSWRRTIAVTGSNLGLENPGQVVPSRSACSRLVPPHAFVLVYRKPQYKLPSLGFAFQHVQGAREQPAAHGAVDQVWGIASGFCEDRPCISFLRSC